MFFPTVYALDFVTLQSSAMIVTSGSNASFRDLLLYSKVVSDTGNVPCPLRYNQTIYRSSMNSIRTLEMTSQNRCQADTNWDACINDCRLSVDIPVNSSTNDIPFRLNSPSPNFQIISKNLFDNNRVVLSFDMIPKSNGMPFTGYMVSFQFQGTTCNLLSGMIHMNVTRMYDTCTQVTGSSMWVKTSFKDNVRTTELCSTSACAACSVVSSATINSTCSTNLAAGVSSYDLPVVIDSEGLSLTGFNQYYKGTKEPLGTGAIVGIVLGSIGFILIVVGGIFLYSKRNAKKSKPAQPESTESTQPTEPIAESTEKAAEPVTIVQVDDASSSKTQLNDIEEQVQEAVSESLIEPTPEPTPEPTQEDNISEITGTEQETNKE